VLLGSFNIEDEKVFNASKLWQSQWELSRLLDNKKESIMWKSLMCFHLTIEICGVFGLWHGFKVFYEHLEFIIVASILQVKISAENCDWNEIFHFV
jgi:hypothetical protein